MIQGSDGGWEVSKLRACFGQRGCICVLYLDVLVFLKERIHEVFTFPANEERPSTVIT